jgi:hypothetical protein
MTSPSSGLPPEQRGAPMTPAAAPPSPVMPGVVALGAIWVSVLLISVFSPDFVSGSQQEHIPLIAIGTWIWGAVSSGYILTTFAKSRSWPAAPTLWRNVSRVVAFVWGVATLVSIFVPRVETGSDPTRIPLAAIIAPIAATVVTKIFCQFFTDMAQPQPPE